MDKDMHGNRISMTVTPDTGAEFSVALPKLLEDLGVDTNNTRWLTRDELVGPTGEPLATIRQLTPHLQYGSYMTEEEIHVCREASSFLLSWRACQNLGMVPKNFPEPM